jgi:hypothetical protein
MLNVPTVLVNSHNGDVVKTESPLLTMLKEAIVDVNIVNSDVAMITLPQ